MKIRRVPGAQAEMATQYNENPETGKAAFFIDRRNLP
jgi:hypothetical protein